MFLRMTWTLIFILWDGWFPWKLPVCFTNMNFPLIYISITEPFSVNIPLGLSYILIHWWLNFYLNYILLLYYKHDMTFLILKKLMYCVDINLYKRKISKYLFMTFSPWQCMKHISHILLQDFLYPLFRTMIGQ